ncbi:hypothetical protein DFH06DRAFT_1131363 [Mycena polygramma]|nr:hypothetical protein DFH06DRAFT_1131363 [Mycena polygramma]
MSLGAGGGKPLLTASPAFRQYQWRSDPFIKNTWQDAKLDGIYAKFRRTLIWLDSEGFPLDTGNLDNATFRAHLGLPNSYNIEIDYKQGYTTKAAGAFWTSLLRFQVLDLLLSVDSEYGVSDLPSPSEPPPAGTHPKHLLAALTKWPTCLEALKKEFSIHPAVSKGQTLTTEQTLTSLTSSTEKAISGFWKLLEALAEMHGSTLAAKTLKNFQAIATGLMWILECEALPLNISVTEKVVDNFHWLSEDERSKFKAMTLNIILRPLSYILNYSPALAICNIDLSKPYGHVMSQYNARLDFFRTRAFLGRHRTPRLTRLEEIIVKIVQEVVIGKSVQQAATLHWHSGIVALPLSQYGDFEIFILPAGVPANSFQPAQRVLQGHSPPSTIFSPAPTFDFPPDRQGPSSFVCTLAINATGNAPTPLEPQDRTATPQVPAEDSLIDPGPTKDAASVAEKAKQMDGEPGEEGTHAVQSDNLCREIEGASDVSEQFPGPRDDRRQHCNQSAMEIEHGRLDDENEPDLGSAELGDNTERDDAGTENTGQPNQHDVNNLFNGRLSPLSEDSDREPENVHHPRREPENVRPLRRSLRVHANTQKEGSDDDLGPHVSVLGQSRKRKAATQVRGPTKKKLKNVGSEPPGLEEAEKNPPKRSVDAISLSAYYPDGSSMRQVQWIGHADTEIGEVPMMKGLQQSMEAEVNRCMRNGQGRRFQRHVDGVLPTGPPADDESDLYVMTLNQWQRMSSCDRVALWGTGRNLFVEGLLVTSEHIDPREKISTFHRLDEPMQVQARERKEWPGSQCFENARKPRRPAKSSDRKAGIFSQNTDAQLISFSSGLDLEDIAYRQTSGISTFGYEQVPHDQRFFSIVGGPHTLTIGHIDKGPTRLTVEGPGEKLWMTRRLAFLQKEGQFYRQSIEDAAAFRAWDPDKPAFESGSYEGVILAPSAGTFFMQATEHIVLGLPPPSSECQNPGRSTENDKFTLVTGGHFLAASTIIPSICTLLHLVMMEHVLTNVEHDGSWSTFVRVCVFWMVVTSERPGDRQILRAYLPQLNENTAAGWMDIVCLASVVILSSPFDRRRHTFEGIPASETAQRRETCRRYKEWRAWFSKTFDGRINNQRINLELDVFSAVLLHLAVVLIQYHERESMAEGPDLLLTYPNDKLIKDVKDALETYQKGLGRRLQKQLDGGEVINTKFFLFQGSEVELNRKRSKFLPALVLHETPVADNCGSRVGPPLGGGPRVGLLWFARRSRRVDWEFSTALVSACFGLPDDLAVSMGPPTARANHGTCFFGDRVGPLPVLLTRVLVLILSACFSLPDDPASMGATIAGQLVGSWYYFFRRKMLIQTTPRPSRHYARVHTISANCKSLFAPHDDIIVEASGAGLSHVRLNLEALQSPCIKGEPHTFHLNEVDTLHVDVDRTMFSWSFRKLTLSFPSLEQLDGFLFALSHIRVSQAYCPVGWSSLHEMPVERHLSEVDLKDFCVTRAAAYTHAHIHVIPAELLSEIFLSFSESPLLLLQICSAWRAVALQTPPLWCEPSFTLAPSFFHKSNPSFTFDHRHHNTIMQILSWLTRARSVPITLSLTCQASEGSSRQRFDRRRLAPLTFDSVKMLDLCCTQSQLLRFLGGDAPMLRSLESLSIRMPKVDFHPRRRPIKLCRSAPLRSLTIETESFGAIGDQRSLVTAFRWSQLTALSLQVELQIYTWIPIFFQCLSLQTGNFILRQARHSYPLDLTMFRDLVCLHISFKRVCDTRFLAHALFPALRELHVRGTMAGDADGATECIPVLPTLRVLILDAVVPGLALQRIILAHPQLEELSVLALDGTMCPDIWGLRYLRILTICAFISDPDLVQTFVQDTAARVVQAVSAGCSLRIFAEEATLDSVRIALADEHRVKVSIHCDPSLIPSPKPVDRLLSPRLFFFLTVERLLAL